MSHSIPSIKDIENAHQRISDQVRHTQVLTSSLVNELCSAELYFKCENFQKTGSFKFRGASNAVLQLSEEESIHGVGSHSSGNHAAALALATSLRGIDAHIVMPENSSPVKRKAVEHYNARITYCAPGLDAREKTYRKIEKQTGARFIHPSGDFHVICGQGTAAKELLEEIPGLDAIIAPVGGGGLISGTAIAAKAMNKNIRVFAGEPQKADDAYRSFKQGFLIPVDRPNTIADGLLTSLNPLTFKIISEYLDDVFTTSEETIVKAMRLIWERMKIIAEPSAAVALAAILEHRFVFKSKKVGIILSGGNVDLNNLPFHRNGE
ncbi:MAG: pyridoxal-phosphate dependent enzyme [Bacteroidales bacterium]|nr:pyridoxal-phosphate dependent enzyme [Bacteroidales bacterium]